MHEAALAVTSGGLTRNSSVDKIGEHNRFTEDFLVDNIYDSLK